MGSFGGFYKGEKKKMKKEAMEKKAEHMARVYVTPRVEIISRGKDKGK
jgi:hypothetical protein